MKALVGIIMGSSSDWETLRSAAETLEKLAIAHEVRVVSAHRTRISSSNTPPALARAASKSSSPAPEARRIFPA